MSTPLYKSIAVLGCVWFGSLAYGAVPPAAIVNGEAIPEPSVQRALRPVPAEHKAKARHEIIQFMVDALLIEQYLQKLKIDSPPQEVDARLEMIEKELKESGKDPVKTFEELQLPREELKAQIAADLRWENFIKLKANDQVLSDFFTRNPDWFDDSQVAARHILVAVPPEADQQNREEAKAKLRQLARQVAAKAIELRATAAGQKGGEDKLVEEDRVKVLADAFAHFAKESDCPSKENAGDLGMFPRIGVMVEPFAAAAFALKPGQMSDIVETQFGYHLILVTARTPGKKVEYENVKDEIFEIYAERLRSELVPQLRRTARIEIPGNRIAP